jgi:hypothetical protein
MGSKANTLNNESPSPNRLLCPIQTLFNLVYLAERDSDRRDEVAKYMAMANVELLRLSEAALTIALPDTQPIDDSHTKDKPEDHYR